MGHLDLRLLNSVTIAYCSGKPAELIKDKTSRFYGMCMAQGPEEFERLLRLVV